jgi:hypothetical protein
LPVTTEDSALSASGLADAFIKKEKKLVLKRKQHQGDEAEEGEYIEDDDEDSGQNSLKVDAVEQLADTVTEPVANKTTSDAVAAGQKRKYNKRSQASLIRRDLKKKARAWHAQVRSNKQDRDSTFHREFQRSVRAAEAAAAVADLWADAPDKLALPTLANDKQRRSYSNRPSGMAGQETANAAEGSCGAILCLDMEVVNDGAYSQFTQLGAVLSVKGQISTFEAKVIVGEFTPV